MRKTQREEIWQTVLSTEPLMSNQASFTPEEAQIIALLRELQASGTSDTNLHALFDAHQSGNVPRTVSSLRAIRCELMVLLHQRQQVLDDLDNYAEAIRKNSKK